MEREKILKLLRGERDCVTRIGKKECSFECGTCSLAQDPRDLFRMYTEVMKILKKPARVLTLEEALKEPCVWMEANPSGLGLRKLSRSAADDTIVLIESFSRQPSMTDADMYGKMYRCWSEKPTEEQRKNEKWEE